MVALSDDVITSGHLSPRVSEGMKSIKITVPAMSGPMKKSIEDYEKEMLITALKEMGAIFQSRSETRSLPDGRV